MMIIRALSSPSLVRAARVAWPVVALVAVLLSALPFTGNGTAVAAPKAWEIDAAHSAVTFQIRHFFTMVPGRFGAFSGSLSYDEADPTKSGMEFTIDAATVNTDNEKRDGHLKNPDFFNVEKYPTLTFKSTRVAKTAEANVYDVMGDFTMLGVTKPITVRAEVLGFGPDPWGGIRGGIAVTGTVNRKDFGMVWNKTLDAGGTMLSDDVKFNVSLEVAAKKS